jgi:hypothetical protein
MGTKWHLTDICVPIVKPIFMKDFQSPIPLRLIESLYQDFVKDPPVLIRSLRNFEGLILRSPKAAMAQTELLMAAWRLRLQRNHFKDG